MKKSKVLSLALLSISTLLTACQIPNSASYVEKAIPIKDIYLRLLPATATCRFYKDTPTIPYIDINSYYQMLLNKEVKISKVNKDIYFIETFKGNATIDVKKDILYSDNYNDFINTTIYRSGDSHNVYYDGAPYLKVADYIPSKEATPKTIDFSKYKIDFKYDDDKLWAPLITYSDMFKGVTMYQSFYNGEYIFLVDSNNMSNDPCFNYLNYYTPLTDSFFKDNVRNKNVAELSYYEMCFVIDNYYGFPKRSPLDDLIYEYGLDYALENYSSSTRLTKEYLLSTNISKYMAGMSFLSNLLNDGGHTIMDMGVDYLSMSRVLPDNIVATANSLINNPNYEWIPSSRNYNYEAYYQARNKTTGNKMFTYKGDTFLYTFDQFDIDYAGWYNFYSGASEALPNDCIGNFHRGINEAKKNPEIKNFVIDLTINGGGFGDVVIYLMKAIADAPSMYYYDYIDERNIRQDYVCDLNLDGEFNELDNGKIADFNFGILTSTISFSCANLLPALAKGNNIVILGEKSGGGACAVLDNCSMEGLYYRTSSFLHLTNKEFESIDKGVEVDFNLISNGLIPSYNDLYNLNLISQKMNYYYKN